MSFYFYFFFCLLAYRTHQAVQPLGSTSALREACCDMSPAFISGVEKYLPEAQLTFDKFHVMKVINDAVDKVRIEERWQRPELSNSKYLWLRHWAGVLRWATSRINNGILEGMNSLIQAAKARARGYRSVGNFITMIYIIAGKLEFDLPT